MERLHSILLVDDDPVAIYLHKQAIAELNLITEVFTATNGEEALRFIDQRYYSNLSIPSLIILDLNMPVMNGIDFVKAICKSDLLTIKQIPVAILTSSTEDQQRVQELKHCYYVMKPLTKHKFIEIIENSYRNSYQFNSYKDVGKN